MEAWHYRVEGHIARRGGPGAKNNRTDSTEHSE